MSEERTHERIQTPSELLLKHLRRIQERAFIAERGCPECKQLERAGLIEFPEPPTATDAEPISGDGGTSE
jgi:hypothetical protein